MATKTIGISLLGCGTVGGGATEWSNGQVINLGGVGSGAYGINDSGQVVGQSLEMHAIQVATEWSNGQVIDLPLLPGATGSSALSINNAGQVVGFTAIGGGVIGGVVTSQTLYAATAAS